MQNVYHGTHMNGVEPGTVKYLRVIESPEKKNGQKMPGMAKESKLRLLTGIVLKSNESWGEVPVEEDGSANFEVPSGTYVYFQLLDKNKK